MRARQVIRRRARAQSPCLRLGSDPELPPAPSIRSTTAPDITRRDDKPVWNHAVGKGNDQKREIREDDEGVYQELPFNYSNVTKWYIITVIMAIQISMNLNTSLYSNATRGMMRRFNVQKIVVVAGAGIFLILYAFGCELWAPWSEELGRWWALQTSLFLVNAFGIVASVAPNMGVMLAARGLGGLSSAGGSVTLALVADMFGDDIAQYAVCHIVLSSVGGSVIPAIFGGFLYVRYGWEACLWVQVYVGLFVQLLHWTIPETRTTIVMNNIAKRRREAYRTGVYRKLTFWSMQRDRLLAVFLLPKRLWHFRRKNTDKSIEDGPILNVWGPDEVHSLRQRLQWRQIVLTTLRPFEMLVKEPIVTSLSLLSGFSDALIFMFIQSYSDVYAQYGWSDEKLGLAFIPIGGGYLVAFALYMFIFIPRNIAHRARNPQSERAQYESRLWPLLLLGPLLPIGLFGFGWSVSNPSIHWGASFVFAILIGISNFGTYQSSIDYMVFTYAEYSASATGGNGFCRDFLAGVLTFASDPYFAAFRGYQLSGITIAMIVLSGMSLLLVASVFAIYAKGAVLRKMSNFAQRLANGENQDGVAGHTGQAVEMVQQHPAEQTGPSGKTGKSEVAESIVEGGSKFQPGDASPSSYGSPELSDAQPTTSETAVTSFDSTGSSTPAQPKFAQLKSGTKSQDLSTPSVEHFDSESKPPSNPRPSTLPGLLSPLNAAPVTPHIKRPGTGGRTYSQEKRFFGQSSTIRKTPTPSPRGTPRVTPIGTPAGSRTNSVELPASERAQMRHLGEPTTELAPEEYRPQLPVIRLETVESHMSGEAAEDATTGAGGK